MIAPYTLRTPDVVLRVSMGVSLKPANGYPKFDVHGALGNIGPATVTTGVYVIAVRSMVDVSTVTTKGTIFTSTYTQVAVPLSQSPLLLPPNGIGPLSKHSWRCAMAHVESVDAHAYGVMGQTWSIP